MHCKLTEDFLSASSSVAPSPSGFVRCHQRMAAGRPLPPSLHRPIPFLDLANSQSVLVVSSSSSSSSSLDQTLVCLWWTLPAFLPCLSCSPQNIDSRLEIPSVGFGCMLYHPLFTSDRGYKGYKELFQVFGQLWD